MNPEDVRLNDLYQEVILDHNKRPRNFGRLGGANASAHGRNPLCGDDYFVDLILGPDGKVQKSSFEGSGCAISKASASMMTTLIEGKTVTEIEALKERVIHLLTDPEISRGQVEEAGRMKIFEGVRKFPIRVKCATLAWRALEEALKNGQKEVTTE